MEHGRNEYSVSSARLTFSVELKLFRVAVLPALTSGVRELFCGLANEVIGKAAV